MNESRELTIKHNVIMQNTDIEDFCKQLAQSAFCPAAYRNNPLDTKFAILWGAELGLNPFQSISGIYIVKGKPSLATDLMLSVCKRHPDWLDMIESHDMKTDTAVCKILRKGKEPLIQYFSYEDARKAKLLNGGPDSAWLKYPRRMLQIRARSFALRDAFPDALSGLIDSEEAKDYPEPKDITPKYEPAYETNTQTEYEHMEEPKQYPDLDFVPASDHLPDHYHMALFELLGKRGEKHLAKEWMELYQVGKFSDLPLPFIKSKLEVLNNV
jgi:hypothetical protein